MPADPELRRIVAGLITDRRSAVVSFAIALAHRCRAQLGVEFVRAVNTALAWSALHFVEPRGYESDPTRWTRWRERLRHAFDARLMTTAWLSPARLATGAKPLRTRLRKAR